MQNPTFAANALRGIFDCLNSLRNECRPAYDMWYQSNCGPQCSVCVLNQFTKENLPLLSVFYVCFTYLSLYLLFILSYIEYFSCSD